MPMSMRGAGMCGSEPARPERARDVVPVLSLSAMVAAHSTGGGGWRAARAAWLLLVALLAAAPVIAGASKAAAAPAAMTASSASTAHWIQIERRIESGYYQQDVA